MNNSKVLNNSIQVQLLQVDMSSKGVSACSACDTIVQKLHSAIEAVRPLFAQLGYKIGFEEVSIDTTKDAQKHNFVASPTIRVNGFDFFPDHDKELSEKRIWTWRGQAFSAPSKEVFIEIILYAYLEVDKKENESEISPYVEQFLDKRSISQSTCCGSN